MKEEEEEDVDVDEGPILGRNSVKNINGKYGVKWDRRMEELSAHSY